MVKQIKAIKAILTQHQADKFKDSVNKATFLANYAKEKDRVKKIEMLRQAAQEGWI
jgi:hypothetical protein